MKKTFRDYHGLPLTLKMTGNLVSIHRPNTHMPDVIEPTCRCSEVPHQYRAALFAVMIRAQLGAALVGVLAFWRSRHGDRGRDTPEAVAGRGAAGVAAPRSPPLGGGHYARGGWVRIMAAAA